MEEEEDSEGFCVSNIGDMGEKTCEKQVEKCENNSSEEEYKKQENSEKRIRVREDDYVAEDGFTLVSRSHKRTVRRLSEELHKIQNEQSESKRGEKIIVCITGKEPLPKQFGMAKLFRAENIERVQKIQYKSNFRAQIEFLNEEDANKLMCCENIQKMGYRCQLSNKVSLSYGIVKQAVDVETDEKEILENLTCEFEIISVKRLNRLISVGKWAKSESIRVCFKSSTLPEYVYSFGCRFKVERYTFPVSQCSNCWKYGHLARFCPTKRIICPKCAQNHPNCTTINYVCVNCKGKHMALNKVCPVFIKEKEIRKIMCDENCTYKTALVKYIERQKLIRQKENVENELTEQEQIFNSDAGNKTYSQVLVEALVHREESSSEENNEDQYMKIDEEPRIEKRNQMKGKMTKKNKKKGTVTELEKCKENERKKQNINNEGIVKRFVAKLKEIVLDNNDLNTKCKLLFKFVLDELMKYFMGLFHGEGLKDKIIQLINYG